MTQTIAKFLLVVFAYPWMSMRDPGTSYAPSVRAECDRKATNNLLWCVAWYFGVVGLASRYGNHNAGWIAAYMLFMCFAIAMEWKTGLFIVCVTLFVVPWQLGLAACLLFVAWSSIAFGLEVLSIDPWVWNQMMAKEKEKRNRRKALLDLVNRQRKSPD